MVNPPESPGGDAEVRPGPGTNQFNSIIRSINKMSEYVGSEAFDGIDFARAGARHERLIELWDKLNEIHLRLIQDADQAIVDELQDKLSTAEDQYIDAVALLRMRMDELRPVTQMTGSDAGSRSTRQDTPQPISVEVKLPAQQTIKNTWGQFDGTPIYWKGFHDRFVAAVHNNKDIAPALKYTYLVDSLSKKLAKELGGWDANDDSYDKAWERLVKVHDRPYVIAREHIRMMEQLPVLTAPATAEQLQTMANVTHEQIRQLLSMGIPADKWDIWICHLLHSRLQNETGRQWDLQRSSESPTAEEMLDFLDKQAAALTNVSHQPRDQLRITVPNERAGRNQSKSRGSSASRASTPASGQNKKRFPCEACGEDHPLFVCEHFASLNFNARKDFVLRRQICPNCLKRGHTKDKCYQVKCSLDACKLDPCHNSLLCPIKQGAKLALAVNKEEEWTDAKGKKGKSKKSKGA